ncbi:sigma-70 family RNA polymerase sigma factor [Microbacterium sp. SORGH_AS_0862]|uniref:sigma-70 family RNA polymerase sigma factor n=1 Tax=Microbacterium sp. SORGH_AS_0862 TaxID=3041789 RepID=UPI002790FB26|nr:sigma-70 family RNA polymerase sigma factor [Microbacterium sp. SORGH_AS_0862]MDQ1205820.1 RNA polymerase sigma factor (sigma-70 family) [Microbacterium sp. SORGH_AS_0862]
MSPASPASSRTHAALEAMIRSDPQRLRRRSISLGVDPSDADDVAQDAVMRAWRAVEHIHSPEPGQMCSWLDAIARNAAYDLARQRRRHPVVPIADDRSDDADTALDVETRLLLAGALAAINDLPDELRRPLLLSVVDGLSSTQIAEQLGLTAAAARQRVARARKALGACRRAGMEEAG